MNEVLHANVFFLIASIATVVFCILLSIAAYQLIKILKCFRVIMERIEAGSEVIAEDVANFRSMIASGGLFSKVIGFIMGATTGSARSKRRNSKNE